MLHRVTLFTILLGSFAGYSQSPGDGRHRLWTYQFRITNSYNLNPDRSISEIVTELQPEACVDLRSTGASIENSSFLRGGSVMVLTREALSSFTLAEIRRALLSTGSAVGVQTTSHVYRLSELRISFEQYASGRISFPLPDEPLPRFSKACTTGEYSDSWQGFDRPQEAKDFIISLDPSSDLIHSRTFSFYKADGTYVYTLGFLRNED